MAEPKIYVSIDVEANGPAPGLYSMTAFGAVACEEGFPRTFVAALLPLPGAGVDPNAAAISAKATSHLTPECPGIVIPRFAAWLDALPARPVAISDNIAFDFAFLNYYLWRCAGRNPLGWSGRRIGDLYCGLHKDLRASWKHLRTTKHTHNPLDDARGNAEAFMKIRGEIKG